VKIRMKKTFASEFIESIDIVQKEILKNSRKNTVKMFVGPKVAQYFRENLKGYLRECIIEEYINKDGICIRRILNIPGENS